MSAEPNLQAAPILEEVQHVKDELSVAVTTNPTNVIPTSPQYGVAIIPNASGVNDPSTETLTIPTETLTDSTVKASEDNKDLHSTPNRNDRFKVVKIASLEPFKRGRWKCMDYVDEAPPAGIRMPQSTGGIQIGTGPYIQTQSLPQQQIQQMLLQSGFTNGTQFFTTVPTQILSQGQYFYPQVANAQSQTMQQQVPSSLPAQFISNQPYFSAGVVQNAAGFTIPQGFQNVQYVPANLVQNPNSAFVPTSQTVQLPPNFQQSQTYAGQPNVSQTNVSQQPMVNGHTYTPQNEQQVIGGSLPTQAVKSVILNATNTQPVVSQSQIISQQNIQNQIPIQTSQTVPVIQPQQFQQNYQPAVQNQQLQTQNTSQSSHTSGSVQIPSHPVGQTLQITTVPSQSNLDQTIASNVYTNPQFTVSVNSLTVLENSDNQTDANETISSVETNSENPNDPAKTNPVVNAIDNKIEQAMDLVKSHLMYTVREEVEVLKEKIAELMERIQQLETENNFLRSQIPKNQVLAAPTVSQSQSSSAATNFVQTTNANTTLTAPPISTPVTNPSPNPVPNSLQTTQATSGASSNDAAIKPQ